MKLINKLLDIVFPRLCVSCKRILKKNQIIICDNCYKKIKKTFPIQSNFFIPFVHKSPIKNIIYKLKYKNRKLLIDCLFDDFIDKNFFLTIKKSEPDIIIPVPLHKKRKKIRGFNQSELLANKLASKLSIPVYTKILIRTKNTKPFHKLSKIKRIQELKNAFKITNPDLIKGKKILLVDDIVTTGTTTTKCSKLLIKHGAKNIYIFAISRA